MLRMYSVKKTWATKTLLGMISAEVPVTHTWQIMGTVYLM